MSIHNYDTLSWDLQKVDLSNELIRLSDLREIIGARSLTVQRSLKSGYVIYGPAVLVHTEAFNYSAISWADHHNYFVHNKVDDKRFTRSTASLPTKINC